MKMTRIWTTFDKCRHQSFLAEFLEWFLLLTASFALLCIQRGSPCQRITASRIGLDSDLSSVEIFFIELFCGREFHDFLPWALWCDSLNCGSFCLAVASASFERVINSRLSLPCTCGLINVWQYRQCLYHCPNHHSSCSHRFTANRLCCLMSKRLPCSSFLFTLP